MVPCYCDHPGCDAQIDRGLAHVCCNEQPCGGDEGCGLYFCAEHLRYHGCERCAAWWDEDEDGKEFQLEDGPLPFDPKPEHPRWLYHLLRDHSWKEWRDEQTAATLYDMQRAVGLYQPPADDLDTQEEAPTEPAHVR
jgi:hypothetical protein